MANPKEYGYYIKGSNLAIIEKDTALDNDVNSRDYGPDFHRTRFISPTESVTNGIELEYIYSPKYRINDVDDKITATAYNETSGQGTLEITIPSTSINVDEFILIRGSDKLNGLHQVKATISPDTTLTLKTKYNGGSVTESFDVYLDVDVLSDESDELPVSEYLSKAVVYFVKAKIAEDLGDFNLKQVLMKEFYRIVEKNDNAKINTIRKIAPHGASIR
jgi:hypothetical protein